MSSSNRFLAVLLPLISACGNGAPAGGGIDLYLPADGKTDAPAGLERTQLQRLDDLNQFFQFDVEGKQTIGFVMPGSDNVPFEVFVTGENDNPFALWHLRMTVLVASQPDGSDAHSIDSSGGFWLDPHTTIDKPRYGEYYILVIRNPNGSHTHAGFVSTVKDSSPYHVFGELVGTACSQSTGSWANGKAVYTLPSLTAGTSYQMTVSDPAGGTAGVSLFVRDDHAGYTDFRWPGGIFAPVVRAARSVDPGSTSIFFTAAAGSRYAIGPDGTASTLDLRICGNGDGTCTPVCAH